MSTDTSKLLDAERAAAWLARLEAADWKMREQFWKWCCEGQGHTHEALLAKATDLVLRGLFADRAMDAEAFVRRAGNVRVLECVERENAVRGAVNEATHARATTSTTAAPFKGAFAAGRNFAAVGVVSAVVALAGLIAMLSAHFAGERVQHPASGARRVLSDGTVVQASPGTQYSVDFRGGTRIVRLERGAAVFDVAESGAKPFLVVTGLATARALGTTFAVRWLDPDCVRVTVEKGAVVVTRASSQRPIEPGAREEITLRAGERVTIIGGPPYWGERAPMRRLAAYLRRPGRRRCARAQTR